MTEAWRKGSRLKPYHLRRCAGSCCLLLVLIATRRTPAQLLVSSGPRPSFEVATIKPSRADVVGVSTRTFEGSFSAEHATLKNLLKFAYRAKADDELVGLPRWADSDYFDIAAKVDAETASNAAKLPLTEMMRQTRLRVQSLLADRFHLSAAVQEESRKVYSLVTAKDGPKLKAVERGSSVAASTPANGEIAPPPPGPPVPGNSAAGNNPLDASRSDQLLGRGASMDMLAQWLSSRPEIGDRTVLNQTGLVGRYDFSLIGIPTVQMSTNPQTDDAQASIFTSLREQLGLQLVIRNALTKVLVIKAATQPTAN